MNKRIIVADDDKATRMTARLFLENKGFDVFTAEDGKKVFEMIDQIQPHFVVLDIIMPGMSGFEVCQKIKDNPVWKDVIVVIFSGKLSEVEKGFDYGADDCQAKPINWDEFSDKIVRLSDEV